MPEPVIVAAPRSPSGARSKDSLASTGATVGLETMGVGGGQGMAMIVERRP